MTPRSRRSTCTLLAAIGLCGKERHDGTPLTSPPLQQYGESYIFAVNLDYRLRIATDGGSRQSDNRNLVKHETLFHNADVRAAGEIEFREGVVVGLNSESGSYNQLGEDLLETDPSFSAAVLRALQDVGARVHETLANELRTKARQ